MAEQQKKELLDKATKLAEELGEASPFESADIATELAETIKKLKEEE